MPGAEEAHPDAAGVSAHLNSGERVVVVRV